MSGQERKITVAELKDAIVASLDITAFFEQYLKSDSPRLRQESSDGWSNRVLCPIHGDSKVPNFFVNLKTGGFKCHACGKGGGVFDFYMIIHQMNLQDKTQFGEAISKVAAFAHFDIETFRRSGSSSTARAAGKQKAGEVSTGNPSAPENWMPKVNEADKHDQTSKPIDEKLVETFHKALRADHVEYLNKRRGLTKKTIEEYKIGWNADSNVKDRESGEWFKGRYCIPVFDKKGECRNIREYSPRADDAFKMLNYVTDKGKPSEKKYGKPARLLNLHKFSRGGYENIVVCEGEWDCLLLNQMLEASGYSTWLAVTGTHGANTFLREWIEPMFGMRVFFCLDCDGPGKMAVTDIVNTHFLMPMQAGKFNGLHIVTLPLEGTKESKDISDYFLKSQFTADDFVQLCLASPEVIAGGVEHDDASMEPIEVEDFTMAIKDRRYIDQRISVPITISGMSARTYHAIRSYKVAACPMMQEGSDCCSEGVGDRHIPYGHALFIEACMEREANILKTISKMACDKDACPKVVVTRKVVMEEFFATQVIDRWRAQEDESGRMHNTQELVQASIYVLQPPEKLDIEPQNYKATGWIRTHPRTCMATFFVETLVPMEEDWKKFSMTSIENREVIGYIKNHFTTDEIIHEITTGVTKIYESDEILYAVLMTYLCPLYFSFNNSLIRGWINCAIIGDSGTGKSATFMRFSDWIELGDIFSALSGTRTGLLYAIKQRAGEWHVSIGRYVQANGKMIGVDETQETSPEEIKKMAVAMDTGYLKVDRVASGGYHTRVRCMFLMNAKDKNGKAATISDFPNGCEALRMVFDPMFIRRLDLAVFVTGQHKYEFYNQRSKVSSGNSIQMRLSAKMMKSLIYWAWTRKASQIQWTDEATDRCLHQATELAKEYGDADQIPLVNPQDFRENLARLSVAYAILDRSLTDDMESVVIKPEHVDRVAKFIDMLYSSPACNLKQFSRQSRGKNNLDDYPKIKQCFEDAIALCANSQNAYYRDCNPFCQLLLVIHQVGTVRQNDVAEQIGVARSWVQRRLAVLQSLNLLEATRWGFKATRKFNLFMRAWMTDAKIQNMFTQIQLQIGAYALKRDDTPIPDDEAPPQAQALGYADDPFTR